jgi:predicted MPP superfamily phosphohydrolase
MLNDSPANTPWTGGLRFGLGLTAIVAVFSAAVNWALGPLHAAGWGQPWLAFVNGLGYLLQLPGLRFADRLGLRPEHHLSRPGWWVCLGVNLVVYFLSGLLVRVAWLRRSAPRAKATLFADEPSQSRRAFLRNGTKVAAGSALAGLGYALIAEPRWLEVNHHIFPIRDLPRSLDGLRAVQLTDLHHGPWLSLRYVRQVVETANRLQPDLILLTGDYVHLSAVYIRPVVEALADLRASIGVVAVLGNHDWWEDAPQFHREFARVNIPLIDNGRRIVTPDRRLVAGTSEGLALCGVGDFWEGRPNYRHALGDLPVGMPRLLLSHNPDAAEARALVKSGLRVDLQISGHTHGGQVKLPLVGAPGVPSLYGQKYAQGLVQGPVAPVFVCRGIGVSGLPVRVGAPPEIAVLQFQAAE